MKKLFKILILPIAIITILLGFASNTFAANPPLSVTFTPDPLFVQTNFLPTDEATGTVKVDNLGASPQTVITEAVQILDPNDLSGQFHLLITKASGGAALYDGSFKTFLTGGERVLSVLSGPGSETYTFVVTFDNVDDDNSDVDSRQGKTLNFNVCVGFQGGQTRCGDTVVGGENGSTTPGGGGTIHGSGGSTISLIIFNVQALNITNVGASGSATITWDTNLLATSQVVYGLASGGLYTLNLIPPNFGYPLYVAENPTKVINHSMLLTGLTPGQTYLYRVVSRASPPTVSAEHQFTVPLLAQAGNPNPGLVLGASTGGSGSTLGGNGTNGGTVGSGSVLGDATLNTEGISNSNENVGAVSASGWGGLLSSWGSLLSGCNLISLLILLVLYLIWRLLLGRKYEELGMSEEEIWSRATLFFGGSSLLAILIFVILHYYCPIPIFVASFVISLCLYAYLKLKVK